jgi:hypothetical protein
MDHGMWSMGRWLGRFLKTVGAAFDGAPTPGMASTSTVVVGAPPIGDGLAWEAPAQRFDSGGMAWQWRLSFGVSRGRRGGVYIGEKCSVISRDSEADIFSNLILSLVIIGRIQKWIDMSSL